MTPRKKGASSTYNLADWALACQCGQRSPRDPRGHLIWRGHSQWLGLKFDISSLAKRMTAQQGNLVQDDPAPPVVASSSSQMAVPNLPFADPASSRRWVMIKHKGAPHVHLLQTGSDLPLCRRRQGRLGRPFRRLHSTGDGIASLTRMGWSGAETLCKVCFASLPEVERGALMRS